MARHILTVFVILTSPASIFLMAVSEWGMMFMSASFRSVWQRTHVYTLVCFILLIGPWLTLPFQDVSGPQYAHTPPEFLHASFYLIPGPAGMLCGYVTTNLIKSSYLSTVEYQYAGSFFGSLAGLVQAYMLGWLVTRDQNAASKIIDSTLAINSSSGSDHPVIKSDCTGDRAKVCKECGYDLRGVQSKGRCPDCGEMVPQCPECGALATHEMELRRLSVKGSRKSERYRRDEW